MFKGTVAQDYWVLVFSSIQIFLILFQIRRDIGIQGMSGRLASCLCLLSVITIHHIRSRESNRAAFQ
jgi:hypothetical protein